MPPIAYIFVGLVGVIAAALYYTYRAYKNKKQEATDATLGEVGAAITQGNRISQNRFRYQDRTSEAQALNFGDLSSYLALKHPDWVVFMQLPSKPSVEVPVDFFTKLATNYDVSLLASNKGQKIFKLTRDPLPEEGEKPTTLYVSCSEHVNRSTEYRRVDEKDAEAKAWLTNFSFCLDARDCGDQCRLDFQNEFDDLLQSHALRVEFIGSNIGAETLSMVSGQISGEQFVTETRDRESLRHAYNQLDASFVTPGLKLDVTAWLRAVVAGLLEPKPVSVFLVGDPGTGKTTLIDAIRASLKSTVQKFRVAFVPAGIIDSDFVAALPAYLREAKARQERVVFIIDEAQALTTSVITSIQNLVDGPLQATYSFAFILAGNMSADDLAHYPALIRFGRVNVVSVDPLTAAAAENLHKTLAAKPTFEVVGNTPGEYKSPTALVNVLKNFRTKTAMAHLREAIARKEDAAGV